MLRSLTLVLVVWVGVGAAEPVPSTEVCSDIEAGPERVRCLETAINRDPAGAAQLAALRHLLDQDPALVERLARGAEAALTGADQDRARSEILDLKGQALGRLGRADEAAEAMRAAIALDDGTERLAWLDEEGRVAWTARLGAGTGRQERAARALLAAGKQDAARALLAHALASGAEGTAQDAWNQIGGGSVPGLDAAPSDLTALPWYPPFPELSVRLLDGTSYALASARGSVLLVDIWASWCAPCVHELPRVQALADQLRSAGLTVLTVNARETADVARTAATALALKLPVGFYDDALDRALHVRALPTILLVDRAGRLRNRWDSYVPDFDAEVATKVKELLDEKPEASRRKLATVRAGGGLLEARWSRDAGTSVLGIAVLPAENGEGRIAAISGDQLLVMGGSGTIERRHKIPVGEGGRLRGVVPRGPARYDLVSFRPGRPELLWIDSRGGTAHSQTVASPLLDLATLRGAVDAAEDRLVLASLAGLSVTGPDGPESSWTEGAGETRSVSAHGTGASQEIWSLDAAGHVRSHDAGGHVARQLDVDRGSRRVIAIDGAPGVGVLPHSVRAAVMGRFLAGSRAQLAIATDDGQLVLVDLATGSIPFRARWSGIDDLAAGDLDGDGRDELVVSADRSMTVLGAPAATGAPAAAGAGSGTARSRW